MEKKYNLIYKGAWPVGPWTEEPDQVVWMDKETQYYGIIRRQDYYGALLGYVGVDKTHPIYFKDQDKIDLEVHGGITYLQEPDHLWEKIKLPSSIVLVGFDCCHYNDYMPGMPYSGSFYDITTYKNIEYVTSEIKSLMEQLYVME